MRVELHLQSRKLSIGCFVMALGGGIGTQLTSFLPSYTRLLEWGGVTLFVVGVLVSTAAIIKVTFSFGRVYPSWRSDCIASSLRSALPESRISLLQTSFPNAAELFPLLKDQLLVNGKHFKIRVLLSHPYSNKGKSVIAARVRLRDQSESHHELEVVDHIKQFEKLKSDVDAAWFSSRDKAKLSLEIRLYDHLPFGPQYHIGEDKSFIGFFVSKNSSVHAPMLYLRPSHGRPWQVFREDFEHAWKCSVPYESQPKPNNSSKRDAVT